MFAEARSEGKNISSNFSLFARGSNILGI